MQRPTSTSLGMLLLTTLVLTAGSAPPCYGQACAADDLFLGANHRALGPPGASGNALATADLDGDGDLDAVTVIIGGPATVFLNNGDADPTITTLPDSIHSLAVDLADLNGDAVPDLARALFFGGVEVRHGLGDGSFGAAQVYALGSRTVEVRAVDLNGDTAPDLVATDGGANVLGVFIGTGDGDFLPAVMYPTGQNPSYFAHVDLDLDGWIDIVVPNGLDGSVTVFMNQGDGTLAQESVNIAVGGTPNEVAGGDFNDDGYPDLVVSTGTYEESSPVLLGLGDGTFTVGEPLILPDGARRVMVLDLNGDDRPDLACSTGVPAIVWLFTGEGDGTFASAGTYHSGNQAGIVAADWTGDGIDDLLIAGAGTGLWVARGNGDGTLDATPAASTGGAAVAMADMNGDGILDLVGCGYVHPDAWFVRVTLGLGDGTFAAPTKTAVSPEVNALTCGDVDGNGTMDVVSVGGSPGNIIVLLGTGDGTLALGDTLPTPFNPQDVALADLDEDGQLDLLVAHLNSSTVFLRRGNGDGTFQSHEWVSLGRYNIVVKDLDR
jgi:hypothetical protein